jgi:signal peptidase II
VQTKRGKSVPVTLLVAALIALVVDQLSKAIVRIYLPSSTSVSIDGFLRLQQVRNPGTAFGIIRGESWMLFLGSIVVLLVLLLALWKWGEPGSHLFQVGLGLIIGGAIGNIIDRIVLGEVVDFIDFKIWPVFNIADFAIVVGVLITMIIVLKDSLKKNTEGA